MGIRDFASPEPDSRQRYATDGHMTDPAFSDEETAFRAAFGLLLQLARQREGLKAVEVGQRINKSADAYGRYESGERLPSAYWMAKLMRELRITGDEIVRCVEDPAAVRWALELTRRRQSDLQLARNLEIFERSIHGESYKAMAARYHVNYSLISEALKSTALLLVRPEYLQGAAPPPPHEFTNVYERREHRAFWKRQIARARGRLARASDSAR
jgi:transcriptional regulator with XRE-family HTH domain